MVSHVKRQGRRVSLVALREVGLQLLGRLAQLTALSVCILKVAMLYQLGLREYIIM